MSSNQDRAAGPPDRNPFATRATRPGAIPYRLPRAGSFDSLIDCVQQNNWWGQILGPHGSGKSTLLYALVDRFEARGRTVRRFTLHRGEKRIPSAGTEFHAWDRQTQVIVDGFEQMGAWRRATWKKACRQRGAGLLVTAHESVGFPTVLTTSVDLELAQQLVAALQQSAEPLVSVEDVAESFRRQAGNLREVFFELYDLYEVRRPR